MTTKKTPPATIAPEEPRSLRERDAAAELAAIERHDLAGPRSDPLDELDAHLERVRAVLRAATEETAPPLGNAHFEAAVRARARVAVAAIVAAPLEHEGRRFPWTRAGLLQHADLDELPPALVHAVIDRLIFDRLVIELPSGGLLVTGQ
jgi:hypothetical protein